jgi:hypothetical protein
MMGLFCTSPNIPAQAAAHVALLHYSTTLASTRNFCRHHNSLIIFDYQEGSG